MDKKLIRNVIILLIVLFVTIIARMEAVNLFVAIAAGLWILVVTWKPFFGTSDEFDKSVGYSFTPDIISLFSGKWLEDQGYTFMFKFWLLFGIGAGVGVYFLLDSLLIPK